MVLEQGGTGWEKIQSIFSAVADVGRQRSDRLCDPERAGAALAASLAWLWHSDAAFELKAAALATASLLATPYVLDYDLVVLAVAIAFFARHGLAAAFAITKSACWPRPGSCRCCRAASPARPAFRLA